MSEKQHTLDRDGIAKCSGRKEKHGSRRFGQEGIPEGATAEIKPCARCVAVNRAFIAQHDPEFPGEGPFVHEYMMPVRGTSGVHLSALASDPENGLDSEPAKEIKGAASTLETMTRRAPRGQA